MTAQERQRSAKKAASDKTVSDENSKAAKNSKGSGEAVGDETVSLWSKRDSLPVMQSSVIDLFER
jgi:hypothetical protein